MTPRVEASATAGELPAMGELAERSRSAHTPAVALAPSPAADRNSTRPTAALCDPLALLGLAQTELRRSSADSLQRSVQARAGQAELLDQKRQEAIEAAREAAREASGLLGLSGLFGKMAEVVSVLAAGAAAVASGGVTAPAIGAALLLLGDDLVGEMAKQGLIPEEVAPWLAGALKITGSILMANAAGGASAGKVATGLSLGGEVASAGGAVAQGTLGIIAAGHGRTADLQDARAVELEADAELARDHMEASVEDMHRVQNGHARVIRLLVATMQAREEARRTAAQVLV